MKVHVLMFDDEGSKEKGEPQAVFTRLPKKAELLNWVEAETVEEIHEAFSFGYLWFKTMTLQK